MAKLVSEKTGMPILSVGDLWRAKWEKNPDPKKPPFEAYWRDTSPEDNLAVTEEACRRVVAQGMIGDFRYSLPIYRERMTNRGYKNTLLVFITADPLTRVSRAKGTGRYRDKSPEEIRVILEGREMDEVRMGKLIFGSDYDYRDKGIYDSVFDSGNLCVKRIAKAIVERMVV